MNINIDVADNLLETDRLCLREWRKTDINDLYDYASVPGVGEMAGWPYHQSIETSVEILGLFIERKSEYALECKKSAKVIGSIGIHGSWANNVQELSHLRLAQIGYVLEKNSWGKGLMAEAVMAVISHFFEAAVVEAFTSGHFTHNDQSRRVLEKCGFTFVDQDKLYCPQLDKTFDRMRYIIYRF